jgi:hypothetical protein
MRVAGQAPTALTGRLVGELKADGQDEGQHAFEKRLPIAQEPKVGRLVLKIDGDGPVCACLFGFVTHVLPPGHRVFAVCDPTWGVAPYNFKSMGTDKGPLPLNSVECDSF